MAGKRSRTTADTAASTPQSLATDDCSALTPSTSATTVTRDDRSMDAASDAESDSSLLSSSSEEPSSDEDEDEASDDSADDDDDDDDDDAPLNAHDITSLPRPPDAQTRKRLYAQQAPRGPSLSDRLKDFLPQLAAANEELERDREAGTLAERSLENVGENDEGYIEMNLGLGVLEERDPNGRESDSDSHDADADAMELDADGRDKQKGSGEDVLGELMGKKRAKAGAGIQEVPDQ